MRISDWSSDVCSSDLGQPGAQMGDHRPDAAVLFVDKPLKSGELDGKLLDIPRQLPRRLVADFRQGESCRFHRAKHCFGLQIDARSEEHTSELQSLMRISYAVFCLKKKNASYTKKTKWKQ